eukprot:1140344-Pelagomonas_calceolata.AAC.15
MLLINRIKCNEIGKCLSPTSLKLLKQCCMPSQLPKFWQKAKLEGLLDSRHYKLYSGLRRL